MLNSVLNEFYELDKESWIDAYLTSNGLNENISKDIKDSMKYGLSNDLSRNALGLYIAKKIIKLSVDTKLINIEKLHIDMPLETKTFIDNRVLAGKSDCIYASLHKSLWETIGIPYVLDREHLPIPYIVMGNNLVKGSIFVKPLTRLGVIVSEREATIKDKKNKVVKNASASACESSSKNLIEKISYVLNDNNSVLVFPFDGRSKDGRIKSIKTTAIQAAIITDSPIIPVDVDYFQLNEEQEFIEYAGKSYTFKLNHVFRWAFKNFGDISVNFGKPIIPSQMPFDRRDLGKYVREQCMDLVKIYSRNVVAYSMMQEDVKNNPDKLNNTIKQTLDKLSNQLNQSINQSNKFVDFNLNGNLDNLVDELIFKAKLADKDPKAIKIYGNNIIHYVEGMYDK
jgi:1-acyl-sn-glycerol-3-phosphate acyltransferase